MKEVTYSFKEFNQLLDAKKDDTQLLDLKNIKTITKVGAVLISLLGGSLTTTVYAATFSSVTTCNFITDSLGDLKNMIIEAIGEALKNVVVSCGTWILNTLIGGSYYICLTIALISVFAYIGGYKKAGKYVTLSTITFFILQSLKLFME